MDTEQQTPDTAVLDYFRAPHAKAAAESEPNKDQSDPEPSQPDTAESPEGKPQPEKPEKESAEEPDGVDEADAEEETDADAQSEDEAPEKEKPTEEPDGFDVKLPDGTTQKVPLTELREGYLRQSDYSRKASELAEKQKSFESETEQVRQQTVATLEQLQGRFKQLDPVALLSAQLRQAQEMGDTEQVLQLRMDIKDVQAEQERIDLALQWEKQQETQKKEAKGQEKLNQQRKALFEKIPDLAKPEVAEKFKARTKSAMLKVGFTEAEMAEMETPDHRYALIAEMAGKYLEQQAKRPQMAEAIRGKVITAKPGARKPAGNGAMETANRQFEKNPNAEGSLYGFFKAMESRK